MWPGKQKAWVGSEDLADTSVILTLAWNSFYENHYTDAPLMHPIGCHVGHRFLGPLSYADDIALIAPAKTAAQIMLKGCEQFAEEYGVIYIFKSSKSFLLIFGDKGSCYDFKLKLHGGDLVLEEYACHLGTLISKQGSSDNVRKVLTGLYN